MPKAKEEYQLYFSERGLPLLYVDKPLDIPVVTLENYTKWYNIYVIAPDGTVTRADQDALLDLGNKYPDAMWHDHYFHPRLLYRYAALIGGVCC